MRNSRILTSLFHRSTVLFFGLCALTVWSFLLRDNMQGALQDIYGDADRLPLGEVEMFVVRQPERSDHDQRLIVVPVGTEKGAKGTDDSGRGSRDLGAMLSPGAYRIRITAPLLPRIRVGDRIRM